MSLPVEIVTNRFFMKFQGLSSLSFFTYGDVLGLKNVKIGPFGIFVPFWTLGVNDESFLKLFSNVGNIEIDNITE